MGPVEQLLEWWSRLRGYYPVRIGGRDFLCDPNHISFWQKVSGNSWEPHTFAILDKLTSSSSTYCDIGAWIGPTVLYAARSCRRVFCMEPDRAAYMYLLQNIKLNKLDNVMPFHFALAPEERIGRMASPRGKQGDSMTSLLTPDRANSMEVLCISWSGWLNLLGNPVIDSLKMDIEGGEFALLPTMAQYLRENRPGFYLSLHPHLLKEQARHRAMEEVVDVLACYGHFYDRRGEKRPLSSLLNEQTVNKGSSCLLM